MDRDADGLIAEWLALLGGGDGATTAAFLSADSTVHGDQYKSRVIEQDVVRTRADEAFFAARSVRCLMNEVLVRYCAHNRLQYMQGLNEILAPFLKLGAVHGPSAPSSSAGARGGGGAGGVRTLWKGAGGYPMEDCERDTCMVHHTACVRCRDTTATGAPPTVPASGEGSGCPLCAQRQAFDTPLLLFERFIALMAPVTFATAGVQVHFPPPHNRHTQPRPKLTSLASLSLSLPLASLRGRSLRRCKRSWPRCTCCCTIPTPSSRRTWGSKG